MPSPFSLKNSRNFVFFSTSFGNIFNIIDAKTEHLHLLCNYYYQIMMIDKRPVDVVDIGPVVSNSHSSTNHHAVRRIKRRRMGGLGDRSDGSHCRQGTVVLTKEENNTSTFCSDFLQYENLYQNADVYLKIMEDCKPFYNLEESMTDQTLSLPPRLEDGLKKNNTTSKNQLTSITRLDESVPKNVRAA